MDLINSNRLRFTVRWFRRGYSERFRTVHCGRYYSSDHDKPRPETNYYAQALGVVVHVKWRPDGKA